SPALPGWRTIHSPVAVVSKRSAVRALRLRRVSWSAAAQIIRGKGSENKVANHDDTAHGGQKNEDLHPIGTGHAVPPMGSEGARENYTPPPHPREGCPCRDRAAHQRPKIFRTVARLGRGLNSIGCTQFFEQRNYPRRDRPISVRVVEGLQPTFDLF